MHFRMTQSISNDAIHFTFKGNSMDTTIAVSPSGAPSSGQTGGKSSDLIVVTKPAPRLRSQSTESQGSRVFHAKQPAHGKIAGIPLPIEYAENFSKKYSGSKFNFAGLLPNKIEPICELSVAEWGSGTGPTTCEHFMADPTPGVIGALLQQPAATPDVSTINLQVTEANCCTPCPCTIL